MKFSNLFLLLFLAISLPVYADGSWNLIVERDAVNLREFPELNSKIVGSVSRNTFLKATGYQSKHKTSITLKGVPYNERWYQVTYKGEKAWIYGALARRVPHVDLVFHPSFFYEKDYTIPTGKDWMAVYNDKTDYIIKNADIHFVLTHDELTDEPYGRVKVYDQDEKQPLFFIRGPDLNVTKNGIRKIRKIPSIDIADPEFTYLGHQYKMSSDKPGTNLKWITLYTYLDLYIDGKSTRIMDLKQANTPAEIQWMGDLDGDGFLDFFVRDPSHYNVYCISLYLSSFGESGFPVYSGATHCTTGC